VGVDGASLALAEFVISRESHDQRFRKMFRNSISEINLAGFNKPFNFRASILLISRLRFCEVMGLRKEVILERTSRNLPAKRPELTISMDSAPGE
jgi:hypothetical protein